MSDIPRDPPEDVGGEEPELEDLEIGEDGQGDEVGGDGADDEAEPAQDDEGQERQTREVARPTRTEGRNARQARENIELRERLARLEGAASQRPQQPQFDPQAQARADAEFYQSLESMSHIDAMRAVEQRATQRLGGAMQMQMAQIRNDQDQARFEDYARANKTAARFQSQVEDTARQISASGQIPNRRVILNAMVGEEVLRRAERVTPQQRRQAAARVAQQTTRPAGARGDVARGGRVRDQSADDEALLGGVTMADL